MKKSILVAPALAVLLIGAAGSVGGTVAWFSSVSAVDMKASVFQATPLEGNLKIEALADTGVTVNEVNGKQQIVFSNDDRLTHASVDYSDKKVYSIADTLIHVGEKTNLVAKDNWDEADAGHKIYYAVKWVLTFTYDFGLDSAANLYLDPTSEIIPASQLTEANYNTYKGFRIAFLPDVNREAVYYTQAEATAYNTEHSLEQGQEGYKTTESIKIEARNNPTTANNVVCSRVWAPYRYLSEGAGQEAATYLSTANVTANGTTASGYASIPSPTEEQTTAYNAACDWYLTGDTYPTEGNDAKVLIAADNQKAKPSEGATVNDTPTTVASLLGRFVKAESSSTASVLSFTCIAWFEGTDSEIVTKTNKIMDSVSANMKFYTREYRAS